MIFITILLVFISLLYLNAIQYNYNIISNNRDNQSATNVAIVTHYEWIDNLNISIQLDTEFLGSLDYNTCSLGKWLANTDISTLEDSEISSTLNTIIKPHEDIHNMAKHILELTKTDKSEAYKSYLNDLKPKVNEVILGLNTISNSYKTIADEASIKLQNQIKSSLNTSLFLAIVAVAIAIAFANSVSKRISRPITAVAEWSKKLSKGIDDLDFNIEGIRKEDDNEVNIMTNSFKEMAKSIQENVNVVKKVADGDMTAFVNIRSSKDSLGKNLYRMVQSNDMMFSEILQIASTVANGSDEIADFSKILASSASTQSDAIQKILSTVDKADELSIQNVEKAKIATYISEEIKNAVYYSNDKMAMLVI